MNQVILSAILLSTLTFSVFGQVNQRRENQQDRIANGVKSGQLTPGETSRLENKERAVNGEVSADRGANGGRLSPAERARVNRQQNHLSKQIYKDKTNASADHFGKSEVGTRQKAQQNRIAQGIQSGKLNAGQTANLENKEAGVNREVRADRSANGGKLSPAERRQVNAQQNGLSRQIHRDKQN